MPTPLAQIASKRKRERKAVSQPIAAAQVNAFLLSCNSSQLEPTSGSITAEEEELSRSLRYLRRRTCVCIGPKGERSHCLTVSYMRRLCRGLKMRLGQTRGCIRDREEVSVILRRLHCESHVFVATSCHSYSRRALGVFHKIGNSVQGGKKNNDLVGDDVNEDTGLSSILWWICSMPSEDVQKRRCVTSNVIAIRASTYKEAVRTKKKLKTVENPTGETG
ncbi:hypothetical protein ALC56_11282 [Trachymyrmex septentrionalis]|uniref:Uncharacterized protein n=1 Tax=Trachymyrmex septentrionalis TaxID=34720 RepID=A0A195F1C2_9HYME|nr:hypothetical protein ALC56_11282 [Trachymyrmex septentrionalis]